jgi:hypothetical protein
MDGMPKELCFQWFDTRKSQDHHYITLHGYVFIAEEGWFDQPSVAGKLMMECRQARTMIENLEVPLILRWEVLLSHNSSSSRNLRSHPNCERDQVARNLCKSKHSHCEPGKRGYSCQCNRDYDGCKGSFRAGP